MTAIEFVEFKVQRHTGLHRKHGIYDKKKPSNLHKNSLFSETYIKCNVTKMENYKWYFNETLDSQSRGPVFQTTGWL